MRAVVLFLGHLEQLGSSWKPIYAGAWIHPGPLYLGFRVGTDSCALLRSRSFPLPAPERGVRGISACHGPDRHGLALPLPRTFRLCHQGRRFPRLWWTAALLAAQTKAGSGGRQRDLVLPGADHFVRDRDGSCCPFLLPNSQKRPAGGVDFLPSLLVIAACSALGAVVYIVLLWLLRAKEIGIAQEYTDNV